MLFLSVKRVSIQSSGHPLFIAMADAAVFDTEEAAVAARNAMASDTAPTTTRQEAAVAAENATESTIDSTWEIVEDESEAPSTAVTTY